MNETYNVLKNVMSTTNEKYELIFINDGSNDMTSKIVNEICSKDSNVKFIEFSRNFGHQVAITAGMDYAEGQAIVIIDADLQDPPEVILIMIEKWKQGYEVVYGKRINRKGETLFKTMTASIFYRLLSRLSNVNIPEDAGDFRLIDRKVCDAIKELKEKNRYVRGLVSWAGFNQTAVEYERKGRLAGKTKYPLSKMIKFALDAITSFSNKPLKLAIYGGFTISILSFMYLLYIIYIKLFTKATIIGWSSIVAINLFFNGIILVILGIIGEYIGRIYDETKNRPLYIIKEKCGFKRNNSNT